MEDIKKTQEIARRKEFFDSFKAEDVFFDTIRKLN